MDQNAGVLHDAWAPGSHLLKWSEVYTNWPGRLTAQRLEAMTNVISWAVFGDSTAHEMAFLALRSSAGASYDK